MGIKHCRFCPQMGDGEHLESCKDNEREAIAFAARKKKMAAEAASRAEMAARAAAGAEAGEVIHNKGGRAGNRARAEVGRWSQALEALTGPDSMVQ